MRSLFILIMIVGVILRFYLQFIIPSFNVDEVALGVNIKDSSFVELLYPLKNNQSAPPLFLWLQKFVISISNFDFWISIKIISFIASSLTILFFFKYIVKNKYSIEFLLVYLILVFNPYILYNSLTLKQYTFDALGTVLLLYYYKTKKFKNYGFIFFLLWSLISNIGLFSCVGYLLYVFFEKYGFTKIKLYIVDNYKFIVSLIPYVIYFIWFMNQPSAVELKTYMTIYWRHSFIPLNENVFNFLLMLLHGFWVFFYSMNELIGFLLFLIATIGFLFVLKKIDKKHFFFDEVSLLLAVFTVHLIFNLLNLYPLSDRLFLYLSILFLFLLLASLKLIFKIEIVEKYSKFISFFLCFLVIFSYREYILFKENDVVSLNKTLDKVVTADIIYLTNKSYETVNDFNNFTDNNFKSVKEIKEYKDQRLSSFILVSRVPNKLKPGRKANEEIEVLNLKKSMNVNLLFEIKGYNVYKVFNVANH